MYCQQQQQQQTLWWTGDLSIAIHGDPDQHQAVSIRSTAVGQTGIYGNLPNDENIRACLEVNMPEQLLSKKDLMCSFMHVFKTSFTSQTVKYQTPAYTIVMYTIVMYTIQCIFLCQHCFSPSHVPLFLSAVWPQKEEADMPDAWRFQAAHLPLSHPGLGSVWPLCLSFMLILSQNLGSVRTASARHATQPFLPLMASYCRLRGNL